jgi:curved DNA-binding protein CbpA
LSTPRTHYDNLKVAMDAPVDVIEAAYRALVQRYHPSRNSTANAIRIRKIIGTAYEVLSDPTRRKGHDEWIRRMQGESRLKGFALRAKTRLEIAISEPGRALIPLRPYRAYIAVSAIALALLWTHYASPPPHENAAPATTITVDRTYPTPSKASTYSPAVELQFNQSMPESSQTRDASISADNSSSSRRQTRKARLLIADSEKAVRGANNWRRFDPNGSPWPTMSGYIAMPADTGCLQPLGNGLASTTVDNAGNGYNVFVKLVANPDSNIDHCSAAWIFVMAHDKFTIDGVNAGQYSIFFRELFSGTTEKTPAVALDSYRNAREEGGTEYYVTVYTRPDGQLHPISISDDVFDNIDGHVSPPAYSSVN